MPLMWIASGLLVYLILGLPFWVAVLWVAVLIGRSSPQLTLRSRAR